MTRISQTFVVRDLARDGTVLAEYSLDVEVEKQGAQLDSVQRVAFSHVFSYVDFLRETGQVGNPQIVRFEAPGQEVVYSPTVTPVGTYWNSEGDSKRWFNPTRDEQCYPVNKLPDEDDNRDAWKTTGINYSGKGYGKSVDVMPILEHIKQKGR